MRTQNVAPRGVGAGAKIPHSRTVISEDMYSDTIEAWKLLDMTPGAGHKP